MNHFHLLFPPRWLLLTALWVHCGEVLAVQAFCCWDITEEGFSTMCTTVYHHWRGGYWFCGWGFKSEDGGTLMRLPCYWHLNVLFKTLNFRLNTWKDGVMEDNDAALPILFSFPRWFCPLTFSLSLFFYFCLRGHSEVSFRNLTFNSLKLQFYLI